MSAWGVLLGSAAGMLLGGPLGALAGAAAGGAIDLAARRLASPDRRRVAFTIAAIALAAKMARADGIATPQEFAVFERLFHVPDDEAANARRFYDLAKQSMAGFEAYAAQAADLLGPGSPVLEDLLDALWLIAAVDGFEGAELAYLDAVAERFGFDAAAAARVRTRHTTPADDDPWSILGVAPGSGRRHAARRLSRAGPPISSRSPSGGRRADRIHPRRRSPPGGDQRSLCPGDRAVKPRDLALILLIDCIWAFNVVAVKLAVAAVQPITAVMLRYLIVLIVCLPWLRWLPGRMPTLLLTGVVAGALFMGLGGLSFALANNVAALAIAGQLGVPFSLLLAILIYKERIHWPRMAGIALSFGGVAVLGFDPRIFDERIALLLTVVASLAWASGNLLFRKLKGVSVLTIHAWLALVSVPLLAAASMIFRARRDRPYPGELGWQTWGWLGFSAIGSSLIGHGGMSWLFQRYPVSTVSPLTLPTPVLSVIVAVLVFGTPVTAQMVAGGVLTLAGIAIITLRTAHGARQGGAVIPIDRPSPNFDVRALPVTMVVLHYTGMPDAASALDRLTDPAAKVSAHWVVAEDGQIVRLVDESRRAWHAGRSFWRGTTDVNSASIGIEIVNPGHEFGYRPFPDPQMAAVETLVTAALARYGIAPSNVVGHSDVAPARKDDPGELFDWPRLARAGLAAAIPTGGFDPNWTDAGTLAALARYGYDIAEPIPAVIAFQRRFRPARFDGVIDAETRSLLRGLLA